MYSKDIYLGSGPAGTAAFFAAVEKYMFFHSCEKSCEGRPGYEASASVPYLVSSLASL